MSAHNFSLKGGAKALWIKRAIALAILGGFAWLVITAVTSSTDSENLEPALIEAPELVKQRPETPGGMKIDHQDKKLFDLLESESSADEATAVVAKAQATESKNAQLAQQAIEKKALAEKKQAEVKVAPVVAPKPVAKATTAPKVIKTVKTIAPVPVKQPVATVKTGWAVQLGSFRRMADAERAVTVYNKKVGNILVGLTPYVKRVDLGAKGIVYRVYFTGLKDGEHAKQICSQLKAQKQACLRAKI